MNTFLFLSLCAAFLFRKGFSLFFYQDDFIHAGFSQTIFQVIKAFNLFSKADFPFYRPIPTQFYFFLGLKLFGFSALPFHLFNFFLLILNSYLLFRLGKILNFGKSASLLAAFFYTLNTTHVAPMFSPAYVHELLLTAFSILAVYSLIGWFLKRNSANLIKTLIFFVFSLMSKETAVVVPALSALGLILLQKPLSVKKLMPVIVPMGLILLIYFFGHFYFYGLPQGSSYVVLLGKPTINILSWYFLWAISVPSFLIDFIGPKLAINPSLWLVGGINLKIFLISFVIFLFFSFILFLDSKEKFKLFILSIWMLIGISPLLPFPKHHLAIEQTLMLLGLSLAIGLIYHEGILRKGLFRIFAFIGLICYLIAVFNSVEMASRTHYTANGSKLVLRIVDYLKNIPGGLSEDKILYFKDGKILIPQYGSSKQISLALGGDRAIKLLFNQPNIKVYFEDGNPLPKDLFNSPKVVEIDSSEFLYKE